MRTYHFWCPVCGKHFIEYYSSPEKCPHCGVCLQEPDMDGVKEDRILDAMVELWVKDGAPVEVKHVVKEFLRKKWHEMFHN